MNKRSNKELWKQASNGGKARAKALSKKRRREIARKGGYAKSMRVKP